MRKSKRGEKRGRKMKREGLELTREIEKERKRKKDRPRKGKSETETQAAGEKQTAAGEKVREAD